MKIIDHYIFSKNEKTKLHIRAFLAQQRNHSEVCGILLVGKDKIIKLLFLKNQSNKPCSFKILVKDIKAIENTVKETDQQILGTFHSHPISEAVPGETDIKHGFFNGIEMIYDVCGRTAKLWRLDKNEGKLLIKEIPLLTGSPKTIKKCS